MIWIDLEIGGWGSPASDVAYFLFNSATPDIRANNHDILMTAYHDELMTTLKKLGEYASDFPYRYKFDCLIVSLCDGFKNYFSRFLDEYNENMMFGLLFSLWILPTTLMPKKYAFSQEDLACDTTDPESVAKIKEKLLPRIMRAIEEKPLIKTWIFGNIQEAIDKGHLK